MTWLPSLLVPSPVHCSHCATSTLPQMTPVRYRHITSSPCSHVSMPTTDDGNLIRFPEVDEQQFSLAKQLLTQGVSRRLGERGWLVPSPSLLPPPHVYRYSPPPLPPPLLGYWTLSEICGNIWSPLDSTVSFPCHLPFSFPNQSLFIHIFCKFLRVW